MARSSNLLVAFIVAVLVCSLGGSALGSGLNCEPSRLKVDGCRNFCDNHQFGEYSCCDEDTSPSSHRGRCPRTTLSPQEREALCVGFPILLCYDDTDCHDNEKCCYSLDTQHRICRPVY